MEDKIIEIRELEKRLTGFQNIPRGNVETAYVFFQSKDNSKYAVTTEKRKIMSTELRSGRYDRIMEIRRGWFDKKSHKIIACQESGHFFTVELDVRYYISDPEYIYLNRSYSVSAELDRVLSGIEGEFGNKYSFTKQAELSKGMRLLIESKLEDLFYLEYFLGLHIDVDEGARDLLYNQRRHEIEVDKINKEAIEERLRTQNAENLKQTKMDSLGKYMKQYGVSAGNLLGYVDKEMSGRELSQILNADKKEQMETNFEMLIRLYKEGIIDETKVGGVLGKILPGIGQTIPTEWIETKEDDSDEDKKGGNQEPPFQWKKS